MQRKMVCSLRVITPLLSFLSLTFSCGKATQTHSLRAPALNLSESDDNTILDYQIGPTWDKAEVTERLLTDENPALLKTAQATAKLTVMFSTGTGFVGGEKDGQVMLATNHHVIEDQKFCDETKVAFEILNLRRLQCDKVIVTDTELDLTLFTVKGLSGDAKERLIATAPPLSKLEPKKGQNLLTLGYGFAGNDAGKLMIDQGDDCKTYSNDGEMRYMADPDVVNPGPYKTWLFAAGCDVSHGDSGSAVLDRDTGEVVGILSTGKIPKIASVRSRDFLQRIFDSNTEDVWSELTYVVPFSKILESYNSVLSENASIQPK
jgi:V8-like Glu-specific endopeptidase